MATLLEMAKDIVIAHATSTPMSKEDLLKEIQDVYAALSALEKGGDVVVEAEVVAEVAKPAITAKKSIGKNAITCIICGESMKTLSRHLMAKHNMKASEYRKEFGIPRTQALAAKSYSETRKKMAIESGLGEKLAAARIANAEKKNSAVKEKKAPAGIKTKKAPSAKIKSKV
jgi:predicted transcriptional regulator